MMIIENTTSQNTFTFSNVLGSNMVLQRDIPARVWGFGAKGGSTVKCSLGSNGNQSVGISFGQVNSQTGAWYVDLPPQKGTPTPYSVTCSTDAPNSPNSIALDQILFGDVFFCAGESNMQFSVPGVFGASLATQVANNYHYIRLFSVGQGNVSAVPLDELGGRAPQLGWAKASSTSVSGEGTFGYFSAVCWFFACALFDSPGWNSVPIGLISSTYAESYIAAWMPSQVATACPDLNVSYPPNRPSLLFNAMVNPFLSMAIRGWLWYQGESDLQFHANPPAFYQCALPLMLKSWRTHWNQGAQLPFLYVQLEPFTQGGPYGNNLWGLRFAQLLKDPNSCFATAIDLGDYTSPYGNMNPRNKKTVGSRLADCALSLIYQQPVTILNPTATSASLLNKTHVKVSFAPNSAVGGLVVVVPPCPQSGICTSWSLTNSKGQSTSPTAVSISDLQVLLATPWGSDTASVGYGLGDWPLCSLFNLQGLPALPINLPVS